MERKEGMKVKHVDSLVEERQLVATGGEGKASAVESLVRQGLVWPGEKGKEIIGGTTSREEAKRKENSWSRERERDLEVV